MEDILIKVGVCVAAFLVIWIFLKALKFILKFALFAVVVFVVWYYFAPIDQFVRSLF